MTLLKIRPLYVAVPLPLLTKIAAPCALPVSGVATVPLLAMSYVREPLKVAPRMKNPPPSKVVRPPVSILL